MSYDCDVCIIGSGAGAGPVAHTLALEGKKVTVLEKGPWFTEGDFTKDEIAVSRRSYYTPNLSDEPQVIERQNSNGEWNARSNRRSGNDFWNGNMVGGSSNLMSGYFHRMKPIDFKLLSEFGPIEGANIVDWPIEYSDMEPYYTKTEQIVGVSGVVVQHPYLEPRSTPNFPYHPLNEHVISSWFDKACKHMGIHSIPTPRAIISRPDKSRYACSYTGFCGSYGCTTKAKGSARAALLNPAVETGNCKVVPFAKVFRIKTNRKGIATEAYYYDKNNRVIKISAKIFVVACQAVETSRLLLQSIGPKHKNGLGNNHAQLGKNLVFSAGGVGGADFMKRNLNASDFEQLQVNGSFVNRALQDWYIINDHDKFSTPVKGGTIDFLFEHANPIRRAIKQKWEGSNLLWGKELKRKLEHKFRDTRNFQFEIFCDWLPNDNCFVSVSGREKDKWGTPVAKIRTGHHPHDIKIGNYLANKAEKVLAQMGGKNIYSSISGNPPSNLMAGGCRFGLRPESSVLSTDCRIHDAENVFVTDGSFMPTGGSVTYTWTIYANAFRVADIIKKEV